MMEYMGVDMRRVKFSWVSAAEGAKWAQVVNSAVAEIRELGPSAAFQSMTLEVA